MAGDLGEQLVHRLGTFLDELHRATEGGGELAGEVDSQRVADTGVQVRDLDWPVGGFHPIFIGRADDPPTLHTAAGHEATKDAGMVIAAGVLVYCGCPAKFAEHDYERFLQTA